MSASAALATWYERAGVRHDPHRLVAGSGIAAQLAAGRSFFPVHLMPHVTHPIVQSLPPEEIWALGARHLYQYLVFTTHFETRVVNRATLRIAHGDTDIRLSAAARADALKIYTDEGYHALSSLDLVAQLEEAARVPMLSYDFGPYLTKLDTVGAEMLPGRPVLSQLLQVVVFETLVTSILSAVPADRTVLEVVRETVADHARDEGRHHAYFSAFFRELWAGLDAADRESAARCLPQLIRCSLEPELTPHRTALTVAGLSEHQVRTVLADSYPPDGQSAEIAANAKQSVRLFRNCGVLDMPGALDAFNSAGLLAALPEIS